MTDHSIRETVKTRLENEHLSSAPFDADKLTDAIHTAYLSAGWRQVPEGWVVVPVERLIDASEMLDELNGRLRSCVDGHDLTPPRYHDIAVTADKLRAALSASPQPEVKP